MFVLAFLVCNVVLAADGQPLGQADADEYPHPLNNDAARAAYADALAAHPGWTDEQVLGLFEIAEETSQPRRRTRQPCGRDSGPSSASR